LGKKNYHTASCTVSGYCTASVTVTSFCTAVDTVNGYYTAAFARQTSSAIRGDQDTTTHQHLHYQCQQSVMHSISGALERKDKKLLRVYRVTCHIGFWGRDRKPQSGQDNSQGLISTAVQSPEVGCPIGMAQPPPKGKQSP